MIKEQIKRALRILSNPEREFEDMGKRIFESIVSDYMRLLIFVALAAGLFNFLYSLARAVYFNVFVNLNVQYWRMINYSLGRSVSLAFFYVFAGTFLLFFASILLRLFFPKIRYTILLEIMFYSLSPLLLFGWLAISYLPMAVWSLFLFIAGIKLHKSILIKTGSIHQRE